MSPCECALCDWKFNNNSNSHGFSYWLRVDLGRWSDTLVIKTPHPSWLLSVLFYQMLTDAGTTNILWGNCLSDREDSLQQMDDVYDVSRSSDVLWFISAGASKLCRHFLRSSNVPLGAYKVKAAGVVCVPALPVLLIQNSSAVMTHWLMLAGISEVPSLFNKWQEVSNHCPRKPVPAQLSDITEGFLPGLGVTLVFTFHQTFRHK